MRPKITQKVSKKDKTNIGFNEFYTNYTLFYLWEYRIMKSRLGE